MPPTARDPWPILVTGAAGLLGRALGPALARRAPRPEALALTDVDTLDVTDPATVREALAGTGARTLVNLAAWTDVDGAEANEADAMRLNAEAPGDLAAACAAAGTRIIYLSTDFVFDGTKPGLYTEADPPTPLGAYGRSKAEGEARVRGAAPEDHLIVRAAWLYGVGGPNFVDAVLARARAGEPLRVVTDQVGCPTWSRDLARALVALIECGATGIVHACGRGEASRWDEAVAALRAAGIDRPVERVTTADLPRGGAPRPRRAVLATDRLAELVGQPLPPWDESLRAYVHEASPVADATPDTRSP